jgi:S1-C subfamily serine protease
MRTRAALAATFLALLAAGPARAQDNKQIYLDGMKSAVIVFAADGQGSGSVIDLKQGLILTNWHVVNGSQQVDIVFPLWEKGETTSRPVAERERYKRQLPQLKLKAKVVTSEEAVDLAVVKLIDPSKIPAITRAIRFAKESPFPGEKVLAIGNPGASDACWIPSPGEVRSVYRKEWKAGVGSDVSSHRSMIVEATSPISPGDSGGPCYNNKTEMVGVTQGSLISRVAQGYSYFIDVTEVKKFLKSHKIAIAEPDASETVSNPPETKDPGPKKDPGVKADPPAKDPVVKKDPTKKDGEKEALEKRAENELRLIRTVAKDPNRRDFAVGQLQKFVQKYPGTDAAREASRLLGQLQ